MGTTQSGQNRRNGRNDKSPKQIIVPYGTTYKRYNDEKFINLPVYTPPQNFRNWKLLPANTRFRGPTGKFDSHVNTAPVWVKQLNPKTRVVHPDTTWQGPEGTIGEFLDPSVSMYVPKGFIVREPGKPNYTVDVRGILLRPDDPRALDSKDEKARALKKIDNTNKTIGIILLIVASLILLIVVLKKYIIPVSREYGFISSKSTPILVGPGGQIIR
jgi:hypothetical protein